MKIISYTDINGKKCYADVENFAATMSERIVEDPTHPDEARMVWYTKVVLSHEGGYILALEDPDVINQKIQKALGVEWDVS